MELHKVKEVSRISAGSSNSKKSRKEKRKQWSIQFIELLLQEYEEEEQDKEQSGTRNGRRHRERSQSEGDLEYEYDPRIVLKGEEPVPVDWDSFEMTGEWVEPILTSELYEDIIDSVKKVGNWKANILYKIANTVMQDYYDGKLDRAAVGELFYECYVKCVEKNRKIASSEKKKHGVLWTLYEYFARVNARKSVVQNEREGRRLVEKCGLNWAGTTYYNAKYYYRCEEVQQLLHSACDEIATEEGLGGIDYADMDKQTQFFKVGGLSYHSVFVWVQQKDNHPGNQYGMKEIKKVPPEKFVYLYRNHFAENEKSGIGLLERYMKKAEDGTQNQLWRSFILGDGRDYHNGMSYLLEGSILDEEDEKVYGAAMGFLQNFILYRVSGCVEFLRI